MLQIFAIIDNTSVMNFRKNLQHNFPKMRGGSKAVWNFSENSSVLDVSGIPNCPIFMLAIIRMRERLPLRVSNPQRPALRFSFRLQWDPVPSVHQTG